MMKLSLKNNLILGLSLSLGLLIMSSLASYLSINTLIKNAGLVSESNSIINHLDLIISSTKDAETGQRGYLLTGNEAFLEPYQGSKEKIDTLYARLANQTKDNAFHQQHLKQLKLLLNSRMALLKKTIVLKRNKDSVDKNYLLVGKADMDKIRNLIIAMQNEEKSRLELRTSRMNVWAGFTPALIVLAAVLSLLITFFFYRRVASDFTERINLQKELENINIGTSKRIEAIQNIAKQISTGDYNIRLDDVAKDELGNLAGSLNTMAESLQYSFGLLEDKEWMQSGIAKLNDQMVGEKDLYNLANDMLLQIVEHTQSHVAALYVLEEENVLHLKGQYALNHHKSSLKIKPGEGLIGQCLQAGKMILLDDIPENDLVISFASGKVKPKNVLLAPIFHNGYVLGVIEIASLTIYTQRKVAFLDSITGNIGTAIHVAQNRKKLQEFLEETQAQAEELQTQHNELEALNEELETQTQKIQASEEELRVQQEELLQSNRELEERSSLLEEKNQLIQERNLEIQQKAEQLAQSTKYKSEFLTNMSHELRTPLNSILLLSRLMADNEELDKEYVEYASVIQSSGQALLSLIDEILDLSKIEAGKMELEISTISLNDVVNDMQEMFSPIAQDKNLTFEIKIEKETPQEIKTDKMRLEQILRNLLSNAFKFTRNGIVSLKILTDPHLSALLFKVKDTGIGIANEKLTMIFEAFQQADGSTKRRFGGTGLGLSISKELAKLLGGEIEVCSQEGVGSEFTLKLPLANLSWPKAPQQAENTQKKLQPVHKPTPPLKAIPIEVEDDRENITETDKVILIVEDDTTFAKVLLDFTRKRGYKGLVAVRGDVGIEMANLYKPLAILLDIQLPVKDGWQVMEELKAKTSTRAIPVHIMSSLEVKKESLIKGAVDFINKPVALEQVQKIFEKLENALSRHPKKVLIVEENEPHAKALSYFLNSANIQTLVAKNVSESLKALKDKEVDCVILDMGMPDKSAYETLETFKKTQELENLPIIVFTGKDLSKGEQNRIKQYADSIIVKTANSYQRILDEAGLFLHLIEQKEKHKTTASRNHLGGLNEVLKNKMVLIADDDVRNIFSLTKALEHHQMIVLSAMDGQEALKVLADNPKVDAILMDMMMPNLDGYQSIKEIRLKPNFKHLPILAVTAKAMIGDREKCIAAGASDYISKPVDVDQLISLLRVWLYDKD